MAVLASAITGSDAHFEALVAGLRVRDRRCIAIALSHLEIMSPTATKLLAAFGPQLRRAQVVGITGPPGVGKSTLVNALIGPILQNGLSVAILAVDPSSPFSGGAILGDRLRMTAAALNEGVFVRSLAAQGSLGGITPATVRMLDGFDAAGFDVVIVETVGTGQSEIDIAQIADVRVVVCAPGLGDDIQAMKAGLFEIADVIVVNKADRPGAEATRQQISGAVSVRSGAAERATPVLLTSAVGGAGVSELVRTWETILEQRPVTSPSERRRARARYLIVRAAADLIAERAKALDPTVFDALADDLLAGRIGPEAAALAIMP